MNKRGYVVLIQGGDAEISGAIADGMRRANEGRGTISSVTPPPLEQVEVVEAEIDRQRIQRALLRVAVGNTNTAEDYAAMLTKARGDYAVTRRPGPLGRLGEQLLKLYALAVLAVSAAYRAQDLVLGRR